MTSKRIDADIKVTSHFQEKPAVLPTRAQGRAVIHEPPYGGSEPLGLHWQGPSRFLFQVPVILVHGFSTRATRTNVPIPIQFDTTHILILADFQPPFNLFQLKLLFLWTFKHSAS